MAVYFFYGEEDFNIDSALEEMKGKLNRDFLSISYKNLDNPGFEELITALRTPPMMFGDVLVVVSVDKYFLSQEYYFEESELADIEDALKDNPDGLNVVFVVRLSGYDGKKLDTRKKLYKILSGFNAREFKAFRNYETDKITDWIIKRAKKKGFDIKVDACQRLIEMVGTNLSRFDAELDKLGLMAYPDTVVTSDMVREISVSGEDVFGIIELILQNRKDKALMQFKKLAEKEYPLKILATIQTMLRKWVLIKVKSKTSNAGELAKLTGLHEFVVKQTAAKLKNIPASDLVELKQNLYEAECRIVSGESLDVISEVEVALIR